MGMFGIVIVKDAEGLYNLDNFEQVILAMETGSKKTKKRLAVIQDELYKLME